MCQATRPASLLCLRRSDILLAILWLSCPSVPQCFTASCQSPAKPAPQLATPGPQELRTMTRRLLSAGIGDQVRLVQQARSRVPWRSMQIYADMYFAFKRAGRVEGTQASHRRGEAATKPTVRRQDFGPAILQAQTRTSFQQEGTRTEAEGQHTDVRFTHFISRRAGGRPRRGSRFSASRWR